MLKDDVEALREGSSNLGVKIRECALSGKLDDNKAALAFRIVIQLNANIAMLIEQLKVLELYETET